MKITHEGDGKFVLHGMSGQTMPVTQTELSHLVLLAKDYVDHTQRIASHAVPMSLVPVTGGTVSIDTHHTQVVLRLRHEGFEQAYAIPHDLAKGMLVGLTNQLNLIEKESAQRANKKMQ